MKIIKIQMKTLFLIILIIFIVNFWERYYSINIIINKIKILLLKSILASRCQNINRYYKILNESETENLFDGKYYIFYYIF